jgi:hypothetical protein
MVGLPAGLLAGGFGEVAWLGALAGVDDAGAVQLDLDRGVGRVDGVIGPVPIPQVGRGGPILTMDRRPTAVLSIVVPARTAP